MKTFLTGLGIGVGLGILLAPEAGDRTRRRVWESVTSWRDRVSHQVDSLRTADSGQVEKHSNQSSPGSSKKRQGTTGRGDSINSLSRDELMTVNGIGPVLADRIISGRPYSSTRDLVDRGIIAQSTLDELEREFAGRLKESA